MAIIDLTKLERTLLLNQYKILEILDNDNADSYKRYQTILEDGYALFYDEIVSVYEGMTREECLYVFDVLDMYRALKFSYDKLEDKNGVDAEEVKFKGFDGNNETKFKAFAEYLKKQGRWEGTLPDYMNTHYPTKDKYGDMLEQFKAIDKKHDGLHWDHVLAREEIQEIIS